jgi:hypothetical protein
MRKLLALSLAATLSVAPCTSRQASAGIAIASGQMGLVVVGGLLMLAGASSAATGAVLESIDRQGKPEGAILIIAGTFGIILGMLLLPEDPQTPVPTFLGLSDEAASRLTPSQRSAFESERDELTVAGQMVQLTVTQANPQTIAEARQLAFHAWQNEIQAFSPEFRAALHALAPRAE